MQMRIKVILQNQAPFLAVPDRFPYSLGRAKTSDLCLDDDTVSTKHADIIEEGGEFYIIDRGSVNGVIVAGKKRERVQIKDDLEVYFGTTRLRFSLGDKELKRTKELSPDQLTRLLSDAASSHIGVQMAGWLVLLCLVSWLEGYIEPEVFGFHEYGGLIVSRFVLLLLGTISLSLISRIQSNRYNFARVLRLNVAYLTLYCFVSMILPFVVFNQPISFLHLWAPYLPFAFLLWFYVFALGRIVCVESEVSKVRQVSWFLTIGILFVISAARFLNPAASMFTSLHQRIVYPLWERPPYAITVSEFSESLEKLAETPAR